MVSFARLLSALLLGQSLALLSFALPAWAQSELGPCRAKKCSQPQHCDDAGTGCACPTNYCKER